MKIEIDAVAVITVSAKHPECTDLSMHSLAEIVAAIQKVADAFKTGKYIRTDHHYLNGVFYDKSTGMWHHHSNEVCDGHAWTLNNVIQSICPFTVFTQVLDDLVWFEHSPWLDRTLVARRELQHAPSNH